MEPQSCQKLSELTSMRKESVTGVDQLIDIVKGSFGAMRASCARQPRQRSKYAKRLIHGNLQLSHKAINDCLGDWPERGDPGIELTVTFLRVVSLYCQVYSVQQMRSTGEQELFKPLSNRTRTKPQEMYAKFNSHLAELQDQISQFNKTQDKMTRRTIRQTSRSGSSNSVRLKSMTQPKYQQLLLNCQLPNNEATSKSLRLQKKFSTKSGKSFNSFALGSSMTSFMGFKSNAQSKLAQSKVISWAASKVKNKQEMLSTMIHTNAPPNPSNGIDNNFSISESIVFANSQAGAVESKPKKKKIKVKDLKQLIQDKHTLLQTEWQKTQRFRGKVSSYLGEQELVRLQKGTIAQTRIASVIEKIKKSRVTTSSEASGVRGQRMLSEN